MKKKLIAILCIILILVTCFTGCGKKNKKYTAVINVRDLGEITVELDAKSAPITVENFVKLADSGFYDGLTFHRIINGLLAQGGENKNVKTDAIKGEFAINGVENDISFTRGTIGMARNSINYDSANSQFFIMQEDCLNFDGQYAGFGHVTSGMEIIDEICQYTKVEDGNGTVLTENQPIIESITIITK